MDMNWSTQEVLFAIHDRIELTPEQQARMALDQESAHPADLRKKMAGALIAIARRLDPAAGAPEQVRAA